MCVLVVVYKMAELHEKDKGMWQEDRRTVHAIWQQRSHVYTEAHLTGEVPDHVTQVRKVPKGDKGKKRYCRKSTITRDICTSDSFPN